MKQNIIVEQLRTQIESRYREALKALDVLAAYLNECQVMAPPEAMQDVGGGNGDNATGRRSGTYRERVIRVLAERWMTVAEIARASGVEPKNARGVLYAPTRAEFGIEARKTDRGAEFRRRKE